MGIYTITKRMEIAGSHSLCLPYQSKCERIHGHNWYIDITCQAQELTRYGMVVDFSHLKTLIHDKLDHKNLNDIFIHELDHRGNIIQGVNPTAENIALWILATVNAFLRGENYPTHTYCTKVVVQESEGNVASFQLEKHR